MEKALKKGCIFRIYVIDYIKKQMMKNENGRSTENANSRNKTQ
jgi:hypothetical protein